MQTAVANVLAKTKYVFTQKEQVCYCSNWQYNQQYNYLVNNERLQVLTIT